MINEKLSFWGKLKQCCCYICWLSLSLSLSWLHCLALTVVLETEVFRRACKEGWPKPHLHLSIVKQLKTQIPKDLCYAEDEIFVYASVATEVLPVCREKTPRSPVGKTHPPCLPGLARWVRYSQKSEEGFPHLQECTKLH